VRKVATGSVTVRRAVPVAEKAKQVLLVAAEVEVEAAAVVEAAVGSGRSPSFRLRCELVEQQSARRGRQPTRLHRPYWATGRCLSRHD
jgi:hypothetical protein